MKFIHISDIHLNFCMYDAPNGARARKLFIKEINDKISLGASFILLTGDITESQYLTTELFWLSQNINRPLYFVLGNHDFWYTTFENAKFFATCSQKFNLNRDIYYLTTKDPIEVHPSTWLIGTDGWYDCRNFNVNEITDFIYGAESLNDFDCIFNLRCLQGTIEERLQKIRDIADAEVFHLKSKLEKAVYKNPEKIIIGTHIPPLIIKNEKLKNHSNPGFYSCQSLMTLLCEFSEKYKEIKFYVYCGHTHEGGDFTLDNLHISIKASRYCKPNSILIEI